MSNFNNYNSNIPNNSEYQSLTMSNLSTHYSSLNDMKYLPTFQGKYYGDKCSNDNECQTPLKCNKINNIYQNEPVSYQCGDWNPKEGLPSKEGLYTSKYRK